MDLPAEVRTMVYEYTVTESFKLERKQIKKTYGLIDAIVKNVSPLCVLPVSTQIQYDCIAAIGPKFHLTLRLERHYKQAGAGGGDLTELLKCPACIFNTFRHVTVELVPPPTVPREPPPGGLMYPRYLHACRRLSPMCLQDFELTTNRQSTHHYWLAQTVAISQAHQVSASP